MVSWKEWNPGLDNGDLTLAEVLETLPGANPDDIGFLVRLIENPDSPFALPGAVTLFNHDCIHILLGRGLLNQDEAFVVGFTMGTSKDINRFHAFMFKQISARFYPKYYRFTKRQLKVFDLALEQGKLWGPEKLYEFPFEENKNRTLNDLRDELAIDIEVLQKVYQQEKYMVPDSRASKRLPVEAIFTTA